MDFSVEDLIITGKCMQITKKNVANKRHKRYRIHEFYSSRNEEGEFHTIFSRVKNDPISIYFLKYF